MDDIAQNSNTQSENKDPSAFEKYADAKDVAILIQIYQKDINRILEMPPKDQRAELKKMGVDPDEMMANYNDLISESKELEKRNITASKWINATSAILGLVASVAIIKVPVEYFKAQTYKVISVISGTIAATTAGNFLATKYLAGDIRDKSEDLSIKARDALERELAMLFAKCDFEKSQSSNELVNKEAVELAKKFTDNIEKHEIKSPEQVTADLLKAEEEKIRNIAPKAKVVPRNDSYTAEASKPSLQHAAAMG